MQICSRCPYIRSLLSLLSLSPLIRNTVHCDKWLSGQKLKKWSRLENELVCRLKSNIHTYKNMHLHFLATLFNMFNVKSLWAIWNKSNFTVEVQQLCPIQWNVLLFDLKCALWFRMHLRKWHDNECNSIQTLEWLRFRYCCCCFFCLIFESKRMARFEFHNFAFNGRNKFFLLLFFRFSLHRRFDVRKNMDFVMLHELC